MLSGVVKGETKSCGATRDVTGITSPQIGGERHHSFLKMARSGTDGLFACPSLRRPGDHLIIGGPWLCVPVSRRVCPFEDERRCDPSRTPGVAPEAATKAGDFVCI